MAVAVSGATVGEAMELLSKHHVSGVPVTSGQALVGVVSATDLMAFAAGLVGRRREHVRRMSDDSVSGSADTMV